MFFHLCFVIFIVYHMFIYIWILNLYLVFVFSYVGPRGHGAEMVGDSTRQGPVRPLRVEPQVGEQCQRDDSGVRPTDELRVSQRCRFDDPSTGPSHAPQVDINGGMEDLCRQFEEVLQGVLEGMWSHI
jgi:hypothetical protein